jgi:hypothetical protein
VYSEGFETGHLRDLVNLIQLTEDNIIGDHIKRLSLCVLLMHLHCLAVKFKYLLGDIKTKKAKRI